MSSASSQSDQESSNRRGRRKPRIKRMVYGLLIIVAIWILGDLIYSRVVAYRIKKWEATIQRDDDGVRVACQAYSAGKPDAETALLMIHGFNDSPHAFHKMVPVLTEAGFHCRVMRLPGFAMPVRQYAQSNRQQWLAALAREIQSLRQTHQRIYLVAHSLGGAISIQYLLQKPTAVDGVVLLAPAVEVSSRRSPVLSTRTWHRIGSWVLLFTHVTESPFANDARDPLELDYPMRTPFAPRRIIDETFELIDLNAGRAHELTVPVLMVLSKHDQVVDWQAAAQYFEQWGTDQKELLFAEDSGHAITVDLDWPEVTGEIVRFTQAQR